MKRRPQLPRPLLRLHEAWSKVTIHEALLDLWMEPAGRDPHPADLAVDDLRAYEADVNRRAAARRAQAS